MTQQSDSASSHLQKKTAVLITYPDQFVINEAAGLAEAAGYTVLKTLSQRYLSRAKYGLGAGKAENLRALLDEVDASTVIFDEKLRSTQIYNLAELTKREIIDRERLILEIFSRRATTAEAKLQVELAELTYELPRAKEKVRLAKISEQPGFFGLGKYEVDIYDRAIKRRISTVKKKLRDASKRRELYRIQRRRLDIPVVSLAGYTGVGKTTLFNSLTGDSKEVGSSHFTTLTTSTGSVKLNGFKILLSDTVGFISRLPAYMIEAFKSTLEELTYASLVLLLVDAAQPTEDLSRRYRSCVEVLTELSVSPARVFLVFNKADLVDETQRKLRMPVLGATQQNSAFISAKTGLGVDALLEKIWGSIFETVEAEVSLKHTAVVSLSNRIDWLKDHGEVQIDKHSDGSLTLHIKANAWIIDRFLKSVEEVEVKQDE